MTESVAGIFKTLIKVPCMIVVFYLIFNLFAFTFTYYRFLGVSYVVMQTAAENNFIPESEKNTLNAYLASLESGMVENATLFLNDNPSDENYVNLGRANNSATNKVQYGNEVVAGVSFVFKPIWPLMSVNDNASDVGVNYHDRTTTSTFDSQTNYMGQGTVIPITISYRVPCLRYYPDL